MLKDFYARFGWTPSPSFHLSLAPESAAFCPRNEASKGADIILRHLYNCDLPDLCSRDERLLKNQLSENIESVNETVCVALAPDYKTMQWHHAGEEITALELIGRRPESKGLLATTPHGRVWCIWTRTFDYNEVDRVLNILRFVIDEDNTCNDESVTEAAIRAILQESRREAKRWDLHHIDLWNPTRLVQNACREVAPDSKVEPREDSIACLQRYGPLKAASNFNWVANEKFGNWF